MDARGGDVSEIAKKSTEPDVFAACVRRGHELGFSRRQCSRILEARAPADWAPAREEDVSSARATRVLVSSMVAVNEASERAGQIVLKLLVHWVDVFAIDDAIGLSASDVAA